MSSPKSESREICDLNTSMQGIKTSDGVCSQRNKAVTMEKWKRDRDFPLSSSKGRSSRASIS